MAMASTGEDVRYFIMILKALAGADPSKAQGVTSRVAYTIIGVEGVLEASPFH
jgi:hypothetical protein